MRQRGRISAAKMLTLNINNNDRPRRLITPTGLTAKEHAMFLRIIDASGPDHFRENETELLVSYVQATLLVREAVRKHKINEWEKAVRVQLSMAMRLRLAPSTRVDPKTLGRVQINNQKPPWEPKED
jgi:hypothetical protein